MEALRVEWGNLEGNEKKNNSLQRGIPLTTGRVPFVVFDGITFTENVSFLRLPPIWEA